MSLDELLEGTPLVAFLSELARMTDAELVEDEPPINEGEIVLGEMTPFERRVSVWCYREEERIDFQLDKLRAAAREAVGNLSYSQSVQQGLQELHERVKSNQRRFQLLLDSIKGRFPEAQGIAIRKGFIAVANAKQKSRSTSVSFKIYFGVSPESGCGAHGTCGCAPATSST